MLLLMGSRHKILVLTAKTFFQTTNLKIKVIKVQQTLRSTYSVVTDVKTCHIYPGRLTLLPKPETIEQRRLGSSALAAVSPASL